MNAATQQVIKALTADVEALAKMILEDDSIGSNRKTGKNTLRDSDLLKNMQVKADNANDSVVINVLFDNYIDYIERGRAPKQGKQPPIDALRDWALSRGIPTDNSTLFLISRAIWRDGYAGRPILATLEKEIDALFEKEYYDKLFESLTEEITKFFN